VTLSNKSLQVLADLKKELLSEKETPQMEAFLAIKHKKEKQKRESRKQTMRHARVRCSGWQRYCQRGKW
jgi:hypothetical protein